MQNALAWTRIVLVVRLMIAGVRQASLHLVADTRTRYMYMYGSLAERTAIIIVT